MEVKESMVYRICLIRNGKTNVTEVRCENKQDAIDYCRKMNEESSDCFYYYELVKIMSTYTEVIISRSSTLIRLKQISNLIDILALDNLKFLLDRDMRFKTYNYEIFENGGDYCLMAGEPLDMVYEIMEEDFNIFVAEVKNFIIEEE